MGLDADGKRFEQFWPEVPYDLYCNVTMYVTDERSKRRRYTSLVVGFADKPFREVPAVLRDILAKNLVILDNVTAEYLIAYGRMGAAIAKLLRPSRTTSVSCRRSPWTFRRFLRARTELR